MGTIVSPNQYNCSQCRNFLKEEERVCPVCSSKVRDIKIQVSETIKINESLELKKFTQKIKGFVVHLKQGWFTSTNKEKYPEGVDLVQLVDRENNFYKKKLIDNKTGDIIKDLEQPLSDHH